MNEIITLFTNKATYSLSILSLLVTSMLFYVVDIHYERKTHAEYKRIKQTEFNLIYLNDKLINLESLLYTNIADIDLIKLMKINSYEKLKDTKKLITDGLRYKTEIKNVKMMINGITKEREKLLGQ